MNKVIKIIIGTIGLCTATFIADRLLNIEANTTHLFFMVGGLVTGVLISEK